MTHLLGTSVALAALLDEPGGERVKEILRDPANVVGISALTLLEVDTAVFHRTGSQAAADIAVVQIRQAVAEIVPVTEATVDLARALRHAASAHIATVDATIAATAAYHGVVLVHRDPHFTPLPAGKPAQETLSEKA